MDDALGDSFVVEVRDLFTQNEVFEQRRPTQARLEGTLIVPDGYSQIRGQGALARIHAHAVERTDGFVLPDDGTAAANLLRAICLLHRARTGDRIGRLNGSTRWGRSRGFAVVLERLVDVERDRSSERLRRGHLRCQIILRIDIRCRFCRARNGGAAVRIDGWCVSGGLLRRRHIWNWSFLRCEWPDNRWSEVLLQA